MTALIFLLALLAPPAHSAPTFELTSPAFTQGQAIPKKYTADGEGVSPPLHWSGLPKGTSELALIMDDPDAPRGTYTHWVLYGISPKTDRIAESGIPPEAEEGRNSQGTIGYTPPSPPAGPPHHYHFKLYSLDRKLKIPPGLSSQELQTRILKHVVGITELVGTYGR